MNKGKPNQAFLLLTNKTSNAVIKSYHDIYTATKNIGDTFVLYHQNTPSLSAKIRKLNHFAFKDDILNTVNYIPIGFKIVPGNNHFPLLQFYVNNPQYDYYWCIEDDVRFNGKWKTFFDSFTTLPHDFISSHIRTSIEEPGWMWWAALAHPYTSIPFAQRIRSFNPIYRIKNAAIAYIHKALLSHWCGHHEVLLPTLLRLADYKLMDFGGNGQFVLPGYQDKYYISGKPDKNGRLLDGSMRWRPVFKEVGSEKNKLYHPVK